MQFMKKFIITLMLAIAGSVWTISEAKVTEQLEDDPCSQYTLVVEPHIDSTVTYMFTGELLHNQPYVDSVWITGVREDSATIYLVSHAQPNEKIDLSSLRMGRYFFFAQIEDCVRVRPLNFRGRWATDFPKGMTWTTFFTPYEGCDYWSYTCELQDNTFIEGRSYSIVHGPVDIPIRQYGQKIYAWINNKDYLLYDFGLEIGDSIPQYYFGISADASQIDVYGQVYAHVLRIDSVLLEDGRKAKRLWYDGRMQDIEYVGSEYGILSPIIMPDITTCGGTHMCCSLDGGLIYETEPGICNSIGELHPLRLPSLCDEWHMETYTVVDPDNPNYHEYTQRLAADTIIGGKQYRQLRGMRGWTPTAQNDNNYLGALREGNNADIYYVPAGGTHEFLLYAFNVQVGDTLTNLWIGNYVSEPYGYKAKVTGVGTGKFKRIDLHVFDTDDNKGVDCWADTHWLDSIGRYTGPVWADPVCYAIDPAPEVICACKEGRKVYARDAKCACDPLRLKSLCDTWNVMVVDNVMCGGCEEYKTYVHALGKDTIIGERRYRQLLADGEYEGALREGDNRDIYCIPAGTTHEYLLYAFNAKAGDVLTNVWLGGSVADSPDGWQMEVVEIQETAPRRFVLSTGYVTPEPGLELAPLYCYWTEGIGLGDGPIGSKRCVGCADSRGYTVLCAYKDGELVYDNPAWDWCYYDSTEQPGDTVKLYRYVKDSPGSSTVDPVDPNQIVATLLNDVLTIREYTGEEITYSLKKSPAGSPLRHNEQAQTKLVREDTFRNTVSVTITEDGSYRLDLTNPEWGYGIYGTFDYGKSAIEPVVPEAVATAAAKILRNGQLLIRQGDRIFTPTGMQIE